MVAGSADRMPASRFEFLGRHLPAHLGQRLERTAPESESTQRTCSAEEVS